MDGQGAELKAIPETSVATLEISFDEAEVVTMFPGEHGHKGANADFGLYDMLMVHCRLFVHNAETDQTETYTVICSPAFLRGKTAAHILHGILKRLPISLNHLQRRAKWLHIATLADAAPACKNVARHFAARAQLTAEIPGAAGAADDGAAAAVPAAAAAAPAPPGAGAAGAAIAGAAPAPPAAAADAAGVQLQMLRQHQHLRLAMPAMRAMLEMLMKIARSSATPHYTCCA